MAGGEEAGLEISPGGGHAPVIEIVLGHAPGTEVVVTAQAPGTGIAVATDHILEIAIGHALVIRSANDAGYHHVPGHVIVTGRGQSLVRRQQTQHTTTRFILTFDGHWT